MKLNTPEEITEAARRLSAALPTVQEAADAMRRFSESIPTATQAMENFRIAMETELKAEKETH